MIIEENKIGYKLKNVCFKDGILIDENGVIINLVEELKKVYNEKEFDISAMYSRKENYEVCDICEE